MAACIACHRSTINLTSPNPKIRQSRQLNLQADTPPVSFLSLMPNGHHCLLFLEDGKVELWETRSQADVGTADPRFGKQLASYDVGGSMVAVNFESCSESQATHVAVIYRLG